MSFMMDRLTVIAAFACLCALPEADEPPVEWIHLWADRHGINRSKVAVRRFSKGGNLVRGIGAVSRINKGETVLTIPESLIFRGSSTHPLVKKLHCKDLWDHVGDGYQQMILHVLLEYSRGNASDFYEVFQALPSLQDYAAFYPYAADLDVIKDFAVLPYVKNHYEWRDNLRALRQNIIAFQSRSQTAEGCFSTIPSEDDFFWAEMVVATRNFDSAYVVPFIDYANSPYDTPFKKPNVDWKFKWSDVWQEKAFVSHAIRPIDADEEILEDYGGTDDIGYVLDTWGFVPHLRDISPQPLHKSLCERLRPNIAKHYLRDGSSCAPGSLPVTCSLAKLAALGCEEAVPLASQEL